MQWKTANTNNWPYLEVNPDVTDGAGSPLPLPQRAAPPLPQTGLIQAKMGAADDIKTTTGQYNPSLGAESNERSGKAIPVTITHPLALILQPEHGQRVPARIQPLR